MADKTDEKELRDLEVLEISLVDKPANQREFLQTKNEGSNMNDKLQKSDIEETDKFQDFIEKGGFDENSRVYIRAACRSLEKLGAENIMDKLKEMFLGEDDNQESTDKVSDSDKVLLDILDMVSSMKERGQISESDLDSLSAMIASRLGFGQRASKVKSILDDQLEAGDELNLNQIKERLEQMSQEVEDQEKEKEEEEKQETENEADNNDSKGQDDEVSKDDGTEVTQKDVEQIKKKNRELEKKLRKEKELRVKRKYTQKAQEEYDNLPKSKDELGGLLMEVDKQLDDEYADMFKELLQSHDSALEKSEAMKEKGSSEGGEAQSELQKAINEVKEKSDDDLTQAQAKREAVRQNPELLESEI